MTFATPGTTPLLERAKQTQRYPQARVIVLNDDVNTFQHVVDCLRRIIPGMSEERAWNLAHQIDGQGSAEVWCGPLEQAELYHQQLSGEGLTMAPLERCWNKAKLINLQYSTMNLLLFARLTKGFSSSKSKNIQRSMPRWMCIEQNLWSVNIKITINQLKRNRSWYKMKRVDSLKNIDSSTSINKYKENQQRLICKNLNITMF